MGGMRRHAEAGAADPDPRVEGSALVFRIIMTAIIDPPAAERQVARAEELMASGRIPHAVSALSLAIGGFLLWHERDDAAAEAFERGRAVAPDDDASGAMTSGGLILALLGARRLDAAAALLADPRVESRRKIWRERAARGAQWYATLELAAAVATAAQGDVAEGRQMVARVHALLGRERFSAVDSDLVATLAAICQLADEPGRARELLADTQHISRTPVTMALAYRTLATTSGHTGPGAIEWRTAEVVRRSRLDRTVVDAVARRMVEAELARLGLARDEEGRVWSVGGARR
jgi:hypothetical protein